MYQKTADLLHLHGRIGSHATKGTGRGTVPQMVVPDPEAFDGRELRLRKKLLEYQLYLAFGEYRASIAIHNDAVGRNDHAVARAVRPAMRAFERNIKKMKLEIAKIKEVLRDHPAPLRVRKLKNLLTK